MLPVVLTCPVWWVARWTVRMLTSLAVAVAFSLGATTLPVQAAAPSWTAPAGDAFSSAADGWSAPALPTRWLRPTPTAGPGHAPGSGHAPGTARSVTAPAGSDRAATGTARPGDAFTGTAHVHLAAVGDLPARVAIRGAASASAVPGTRWHLTGRPAPSALGSRAPPAR